MILILISIIVAFGASAALMHYGWERTESMLAALTGLLLCIASGITAVVYAFSCWAWFAADYKAEIINREYGTSYTKEEVFWAANVIDTIRELDRKRIEVNGDVMRDDPDDE